MIAKRALLKSVLLGTIASVITMTAIVVTTGSARADGDTMHNPNGGTLNANCAGCHRIHTAVGANLLRQTDVVALCLTCHGGGAGSDLNVNTGTGAAGGALRGGGFVSTLINTADPSEDDPATPAEESTIGVVAAPGNPVTSKHNVGEAGLPIWGNAAGWSTSLASFTCANCHDPHGGSDAGKPTYRILRVIPTGSGKLANAVVTDEGTPKHYTTTDYYQPRGAPALTAPAVASSNPIPILSTTASGGISAWCAQCHTAYLNDFPAEDADGNQLPNGTVGNYVGKFMHKGMDTRENPPGTIINTSLTCTKCHVGHGTSAVMHDNLGTTGASGLLYPDGTTAAAGEDSRLLRVNDRGICRKCHDDK